MPLALYFIQKKDVLSSLTRNKAYKRAWNILIFGNLLVYGPLTVLWILSYMATLKTSSAFMRVYKTLKPLG